MSKNIHFRSVNSEIRRFYLDMLKELRKNIGKKSEFNTLITEKMIGVIEKRFQQLCKSNGKMYLV